MVKLLQNKVSESKMTLPVVAVYSALIWMLSGLVVHAWWSQFLCFIASTYLMVELNNQNALIRIYSRMVSSSFIVLSCCACFLFPSLRGAVMQLCIIGAWLLLFNSYQDRLATGWVYYAFVCIGLASMAFVHVLYLIPLLWLFMATHFQSLSWRTFGASLLGLFTPYWALLCWYIYQGDFTPIGTHFAQLADFQLPVDYGSLPVSSVLTFAFLIIVALTGIVHYIRTHYQDKIRIRQLYGFFIWMTVLSAVMLALQPQHAQWLLRIMIINVSPLVAHFIALTRTKITNAAFLAFIATALLLTAFNLWNTSSLF